MHPTLRLLKDICAPRLVIPILANRRKMPHRPRHSLALDPSHENTAQVQIQRIVGPVLVAALPPAPIRLPTNRVAIALDNTVCNEVDVGASGTATEGPKRDLRTAHPGSSSGAVGSGGVGAVLSEDGDDFVVGGVGGEGVECEVEGGGDVGLSTVGGDAGREGLDGVGEEGEVGCGDLGDDTGGGGFEEEEEGGDRKTHCVSE